jgi:hypothetical protein
MPVGSDYDPFVKAVRKFGDEVEAKGGRFVQIDIKPGDLLAWCQARGRQVNSESRSDDAATRLIEFKKQ